MIISNPKDIENLLNTSKTIAVVGMSPNPDRDSNKVGKYLIDRGYNVIPVNPTVNEIYGIRTYPDLKSIPKDIKIDIVDVFRNPDAAKEVIKESVPLNPRAVWLQLGAESRDAVELALKLGLNIIYGICIMETHKKIQADEEFFVPELEKLK